MIGHSSCFKIFTLINNATKSNFFEDRSLCALWIFSWGRLLEMQLLDQRVKMLFSVLIHNEKLILRKVTQIAMCERLFCWQ